jgi:hypothetical protein
VHPVREPSPEIHKVEGDTTRHPSVEDGRFSIPVDDFEKRFRLSEEQQQQEFLQEDEHRNLRFSEAEAARDEAETKRMHSFEQREGNRDQRFGAMMSVHQYDFEGSEASRGWKEDRRTQEFQVAEEERTQSFDQTLFLIQKQYYVLDALEVDALQSMRQRIAKVSKVHWELFEQGRQQRYAAFSLSQERRELDLQVPALEIEQGTVLIWKKVPNLEPLRPGVGLFDDSTSTSSIISASSASASSACASSASASSASASSAGPPSSRYRRSPPTGFVSTAPSLLFNGASPSIEPSNAFSWPRSTQTSPPPSIWHSQPCCSRREFPSPWSEAARIREITSETRKDN